MSLKGGAKMNSYLIRLVMVCVCLSSIGLSLDYTEKDLRDPSWSPYPDRKITVEERKELSKQLKIKAKAESKDAKLNPIPEINTNDASSNGTSPEKNPNAEKKVNWMDNPNEKSEPMDVDSEESIDFRNLEANPNKETGSKMNVKADEPYNLIKNLNDNSSDKKPAKEVRNSFISDWTAEDFIATLSGAQASAWGRPYTGDSTRGTHTIGLDGDGYCTSETTWNLFDVANQSWYFDGAQDCLSNNYYETTVDIAAGDYQVVFWDSWGDSSPTAVYLDGSLIQTVYIYDGPTSVDITVADLTACDDDAACNTGDLANCSYPETGFDCDGNCASATASLVTFTLYDSAYDGFEGTVTFDGTVMSPSGYSDSYTFCLDDGDYSYSYVCGSYCSEHSWVITFDGTTIGSGQGSDSSAQDLTFTLGGVYGCTDSAACNYNASATVDDSSCISRNGCDSCPTFADDGSSNGDADESCLGCTDSAACNYDDTATVDDNSCVAFGSLSCPFDLDDDGTATGVIVAGNTDFYNWTVDDQTYLDHTITVTPDADLSPYLVLYDSEGYYVAGSSSSIVRTSLAPGDYLINVQGYFSSSAGGYELSVESRLLVVGCTDVNAENYNPQATSPCQGDDGVDNSCCTFLAVQGCTDSTACNYDSDAEQDDGSCVFPGGSADCALSLSDDGSGSGSIESYGAAYYNWSIGDGNYASHKLSLCGSDFDTKMDLLQQGQGEYTVLASNDDSFNCSGSQSEINLAGDTAAGDYVIKVYGYSSSSGNYLLETTSVLIVSGCTDTFADNYDANATVACNDSGVDNDCCTYSEIYGCMDATACNYNENATASNDSCIFAGGSSDCPTADGVSNIGPLTDWGYNNYGPWTQSCASADGFGAVLDFNFDPVPSLAVEVAAGNTAGLDGLYYLSGLSIDLEIGECVVYRSYDLGGNVCYFMNPCSASISGVVNENPDPSLTGGCTDTTANNYNSEADYDDGSCTYPGATCEDAAVPTLPLVDFQGSTASFGDNYSITPCDYNYLTGNEYVMSLSFAEEVILAASVDGSWAGIQLTTDCPGAADNVCVAEGGSSLGSGFTQTIAAGDYFLIVSSYASPQTIDFTLNVSATPTVEGCTDPTATNYDASANVACTDCCEYPADCVDFTITTNDSWGDGWGGQVLSISLDGSVVWSTTGPGASVLVENACLAPGLYDISVSSGSYNGECSWTIAGADGVILAEGGAPGLGCLDNSDTEDCPVLGCMLADAPNYNSDATVDDGSCAQYAGGPYSYWAGPQTDADGNPTEFYLGCGLYYIYEDADLNGVADQQGDGECNQSGSYGLNCAEFEYDGCDCGPQYTDANDFCYEVPVYGCTDITALNYDASATVNCTTPDTQDSCVPCDYTCPSNAITINLIDSFGDGWNGGSLTMGGIDFTIETGSAATADLCLDDGTYDVVIGQGSYPGEMSWNIVDANDSSFNFGNIVLQGDGYSGTVSLTLPVPEYVCGDGTCNDSTYTDVDGNPGTETCAAADATDGCYADCGACPWVGQDAPVLESNGTYYNTETNPQTPAVSFTWNAISEGYTCSDIIADPTLDSCYLYSSGGGQYTCDYLESLDYDCSLVRDCGLCYEPSACDLAGGNSFYISDGECDTTNNNETCGFDGGDCCCATCDDTGLSTLCDAAYFDCQDPAVTQSDCDCLAADDDPDNDCFDEAQACADLGGFYCSAGSFGWVTNNCITNPSWLCDALGADCLDGADQALVEDGGVCTAGCTDSSACNYDATQSFDFLDATQCTYPSEGFDCDGNEIVGPVACDADWADDSSNECGTHEDCGAGYYCYASSMGNTCYSDGTYGCCWYNDSIDTDCDGDEDYDDCPLDCGLAAAAGNDLHFIEKYDPRSEDMMLISSVYGFRDMPIRGPGYGGTWTDRAIKKIINAGQRLMPEPTVINLETGEVIPGDASSRAVSYEFTYATSSGASTTTTSTPSILLIGFTDLEEVCGVVSAVSSVGTITSPSNTSCSQAGFSDTVSCDGTQLPEYTENWLGDGDCDSIFACEEWNCDAGDCLDACGVCGGSGPQFTCWDGTLACSAGDCGEEPAACVPGDLNDSDDVNVLDVVALVAIVLAQGYDECGDLNNDGFSNVLDVVAQVAIVLAGDGGNARVEDASSAVMSVEGNTLNIIGNGYIGAVQVTLLHSDDFSIDVTENAMVSDFITNENTTTLIVVAPESSEIFTANGDYEIVDVIAANSSTYVDVIEVSSFALKSAYPNPFNPSTSLSLDMPMNGYVSVKAYNLVGQVVGVIAEGNIDAGMHTFNWDASNLSSGVYLITAEYAGNISTQKVMLMK
tara:strand:- start:1667 stop:8599 length:6933 start_codon:yes stop_codon:yes gene_type:complete